MSRRKSAKHNLSMSDRTEVFIEKNHFSDLGFPCLRWKTDQLSLLGISNIAFCFCFHVHFASKTSLILFERKSIDNFPTVNHKRKFLFRILALGIWQHVRPNSFRGVLGLVFHGTHTYLPQAENFVYLTKLKTTVCFFFSDQTSDRQNFFL